MPELVFDPLGRRRVLLAPERAKRGAPAVEATAPDPAPCDFCGSQEARTPPETYSIRHDGSAPDTPGWRVRVVPNLYPATPLHEVVVHTPDHLEHFEDQTPERRLDVMLAYRARLSTAPTVTNLIVWNRGRASGASRTHAHGQIFGLDVVPPTIERETASFEGDPCILCEMTTDPALSVADARGCRVIAHPFPFVADELLIVPGHGSRFEDVDEDGLAAVGEAIDVAINGTLRAHGAGVPFNLVFHTAPRETERFHWHAHLMPRTAIWGGIELGAELPIVASDPQETARRLRTS